MGALRIGRALTLGVGPWSHAPARHLRTFLPLGRAPVKIIKENHSNIKRQDWRRSQWCDVSPFWLRSRFGLYSFALDQGRGVNGDKTRFSSKDGPLCAAYQGCVKRSLYEDASVMRKAESRRSIHLGQRERILHQLRFKVSVHFFSADYLFISRESSSS